MTRDSRTGLRAYYVTHYARTQLTEVVAAHSAREAISKAEAGEGLIDDWAGEAFPMTRPRARRAPEYDDSVPEEDPR